MKNLKGKISTSLVFIALGCISASSQILTSGFYPKKGDLTIAPSYTYKEYSKFWRGTELNDGNPGNLGEIKSNIINLYAEYGITDKISFDLSIPFIETTIVDGGNDPVLGESTESNIQDLTFFAKYKLYENGGDYGKFKAGIAAGISLPLSDYEGGGVISIGNQATTYNVDGILQYELPINLFLELQGGYSVKESSDFDVPDAWAYGIKLGYFTEAFYIHAELDVHDSVDGVDIAGPGFRGPAFLPETEVDYKVINLGLYVPIYKQTIGISAGSGFAIDGRNFSRENSFTLGLVYKK